MAIIQCRSCAAPNRVGAISRGTPRCPRCKSPLPWLVNADASTFDDEATASVTVVVDFWAAWCGPCRMIAPVLQDLAVRHAGRLKVVKVDVDANARLAARFGAQSIPLLVVLREGREVDRIVGRAAASRAGAATRAAAHDALSAFRRGTGYAGKPLCWHVEGCGCPDCRLERRSGHGVLRSS